MAAHYYNATTGELIDGDLRVARKVGGLPSPTTVLGMLTSQGLIEYFKRQMHEATATTPRQPGWSDENYFDACCRWADEHGKAAREKGGDFHSLVQRFHQGRLSLGALEDEGHPLLPQMLAYREWCQRHIAKTLAVEEVVRGDGYAGRRDHLAQLMGMGNPLTAVVDAKTQDIRKRGKFNAYPEWALQLGAYAGAQPIFGPPVKVDCIVSIMVSSHEPVVVEAHYWPQPPEVYHRAFLNLLEVWKFWKNYYPQ